LVLKQLETLAIQMHLLVNILIINKILKTLILMQSLQDLHGIERADMAVLQVRALKMMKV